MKHRLSLEKKLAAIKMVKDGQSARSVSDKLHLGHHLLYEWISVYKEKGVDGLKTDNKRKSKHLSHEEKCKIIREYQENDLPLYQVCARHGISLSALTNRLTVVEKGGFESLACPKNKRCKSGMTRKKRQPKGDLEKEYERLLKENECLRAENLLLKKVKALVEEREAQNRAIGHAPLKN